MGTHTCRLSLLLTVLQAYGAQEESQLSLCWMYVSAAKTMCQTLGYHRESSYRNDTPEVAQSKRHAFYGLYAIDKNLSLVLGRSSNFNDNDIDAEPFMLSSDPGQWPWDVYTHICYRFARIQGDTYDQLYSASATKHSQYKRSCFVEELSARIINLREELQLLDPSGAYYSEVLQMAKESADFIVYAVLSVVYRAETRFYDTVEISSRCYDASRKSLESHLQCSIGLRTCSIYQKIGYVKNTLLIPSFTPYLVVFTHAIATANDRDLKLLEDTVESLAYFQDCSPGSSRLYFICKSFLNTAETLIASRKSFNGLEQHEDGSLVFTTKPIATASDRQTVCHEIPAAWNGSVFPGAAGTEGSLDLDTFSFWTNWLGSTESVADVLR
ncbi:hypothetical protein AA0117_g10109 [Alternaria alternata]|uniref:Xylanolytic transcriptional activator regulatory domain-containing protein n=1 Tax=Alternaria alternata TaxID=5599 RepID=A0A4Q4N6Y6_ALTAL|nr:hypothetical protein AA0117_g10109 [Alternaria alternata]